MRLYQPIFIGKEAQAGTTPVNPDGAEGTGFAGTLTVNLDLNVDISNATGTGFVGSLSVNGSTVVDIDGVQGTGFAAALSPTTTLVVDIDGVQGTGFAAALSPTTTLQRTLTNALPMKNNTGTVQSSLTNLIINAYSTTDGTLVARFTGETTDASGYWSVSSDQFGLGSYYVVNVLHLNGESVINTNANKGITVVQAT